MPSLYSDFLAAFNEGDSVFIPGSSAEPRGFVQALSDHADHLPAIHITNTFLPGINNVPLAAIDNTLTETVFFPRGGELFDSKRVQFYRDSWLGTYQRISQMNFDWVVVQVSPPDQQGKCSLGSSVEFLPLVLQRSKRVMAVVNQQMPRVKNAPALDSKAFDLKVEINAPLVTYETSATDDVSESIAAHLTELIHDGSVIQIGLGNVPDQFVKNLKDHTNLRFHSGMLSDSFGDLFDSGALDREFQHQCTLTLGSNPFYRKLSEIDILSLLPVNQTHALESSIDSQAFVAINSALQIDLSGRANLEFLGNRRISNVGGALDFSKRANNESSGLNIISLPATAAGGKYSRLVAEFGRSEQDSLQGTSVDYVVTEFGAAHLTGLSLSQRAEALIAIAAPEFQQDLSTAIV